MTVWCGHEVSMNAIQKLRQLIKLLQQLPNRIEQWWAHNITVRFTIEALPIEPFTHRKRYEGSLGTNPDSTKSRDRIQGLLHVRVGIFELWKTGGGLREKPAPWPQPLGWGDDDGTVCLDGMTFAFVAPIQRSHRVTVEEPPPLPEEAEVVRLTAALEKAQADLAHRLQFLAGVEESKTRVIDWRTVHA